MRDGDWLIGMGCATAVYPTNVGAATARVRLTATGKVLVQSASHEIGTGIRTVAGQMAAEQLGVEFNGVIRCRWATRTYRLPPYPVAPIARPACARRCMKACGAIRSRDSFNAAVDTEGRPPGAVVIPLSFR